MAAFPVNVEYAERGTGPAVLLVPGSFGTGSGWRAVMDQLGAGYRFITTSLLGYGATAERRLADPVTMHQQTEVLDVILERIGEPAHVVGHSFGGLAALAHVIGGRIKPASLTLVEANPLGLLRIAGEDRLYEMFGTMTTVYFAEFHAGGRESARHVIDFYGGAGTFDTFPPKVREYIVATTASNIRDWAAGTAFEPALTDYAAIPTSTVVVRGGNGHPAMLRIGELLATTLQQARLETIAGGSHFLPGTHPSEIARLIAAHVREVAGTAKG